MINQAVTFIPDPGEPVRPTAPTNPAPETSGWLDHITGWTSTIPAWSWALALGALTVFTLVSLPYARSQAYKAGQRASGTTTSRKGTALFVAAMVPAAFFWLAVLAGSFRGLAGFGTDTLKWQDGWEYLVPLTLDGIAISFGFLAFRAVSAGRSPERANRVVMATAAASALINYGHEVSVGGSKLGGGYLALLSVLGMLIFHEFLDQFTEGTAYVQRVNPKFGLRWVTWPSNTVCAWIAWRNYPPTPLPANPSDGQKRWWGSVNHAVAHLNTVRRAKRIAQFDTDRQTRLADAPVWLVKVPAVRKLTATLTAQQAEMVDMSARLDKVAADFAAERARAEAAEELAENAERRASAADTARVRAEQLVAAADRKVTASQSELTAALARLDQVEKRWIDAKQEAAVSAQALSVAQSEVHTARLTADRAEKAAAALRSALTEQAEKHTTELAENEARIRAEMGTVSLTAYRTGERGGTRTATRRGATVKRGTAPNAPRMTDEEAVQALLRAHPEPEWEWSQPQIREITGAGGKRLVRLQEAVANHHRREAEKRGAVSGETATVTPAGRPSGDVTAPTGKDTQIARPFADAR